MLKKLYVMDMNDQKMIYKNFLQSLIITLLLNSLSILVILAIIFEFQFKLFYIKGMHFTLIVDFSFITSILLVIYYFSRSIKIMINQKLYKNVLIVFGQSLYIILILFICILTFLSLLGHGGSYF